jgi:hypothetical protein
LFQRLMMKQQAVCEIVSKTAAIMTARKSDVIRMLVVRRASCLNPVRRGKR